MGLFLMLDEYGWGDQCVVVFSRGGPTEIETMARPHLFRQ